MLTSYPGIVVQFEPDIWASPAPTGIYAGVLEVEVVVVVVEEGEGEAPVVSFKEIIWDLRSIIAVSIVRILESSTAVTDFGGKLGEAEDNGSGVEGVWVSG